MTDPRLSAALKSALCVWLDGALLLMREHTDHVAELRRAMRRASCDVRIVYHMRANAITIESLDAKGRTVTVTELFREQLIQEEVPSETKH
jgi:hypothetical protein